jgi:hypothetical protein
MTFWHPFWLIFSRSPAVAASCWPPPSTRFYCYYRPPYGWRSPARLWSADQCGTNQDSNQFLVPGCVIVGGVVALALSNRTAGAPLFCADSRNCSALWHTIQIPGEVSLDLENARSKLTEPR